MNWQQTLIVAAVPALVTALALLWQNHATAVASARESQRAREHEMFLKRWETMREAHLAAGDALAMLWRGSVTGPGDSDQTTAALKAINRLAVDCSEHTTSAARNLFDATERWGSAQDPNHRQRLWAEARERRTEFFTALRAERDAFEV